MPHRRRRAPAVAAMVALALTASSAGATTLVVTNTYDDGFGSLRQVILDAAGGDTITFDIPPTDPNCADGTCTMTLSAELRIDKSLTIQGPGAAALVLSGNDQTRVFNIGSDSTAIAVALTGLTIARGLTLEPGGGLLHSGLGTLTLKGSVVGENMSRGKDGGGIANLSGTVRISDSTIRDNRAHWGDQPGNPAGGGILNDGDMTIEGSAIAGNWALYASAFNATAATPGSPRAVLWCHRR